jgi:hypothetical protein
LITDFPLTRGASADKNGAWKLETIQFRSVSKSPAREALEAGRRRGFPDGVALAKTRTEPSPARRAASGGLSALANRHAKNFFSAEKTSCAPERFEQIVVLPNTHVPVVVCRSAGIWTRGQSTARGRPAAGGEPANPAKRGTRLEATTDRAFLVSAGPPKVGAQRGLSILPGVRTGFFLVQTMALIAEACNRADVRHGYGAAADCSRASAGGF